jgi:phosphohistidine phosphatase SixA
MRLLRALLLCLILPTTAATQTPDLSPLAVPGAIGLMRHALAPGTGDPANFRLGDCSTQRNLDAAGRAQARKIGEAMRAAGLRVDNVWTSQWCRSAETARLLGMGPPEEVPALNSFFAGRGDAQAQTRDTLARIAALPEGARALLVSHFVNIRALTGVGPRSGEIVVVQRGPDGLRVTARILLAP